MTPKETLAKWIGDNAGNIDGGYLTELRGLGAERIIAALWEAGYAIVPIKPDDRMLDELARIGDGPMISGEEYMLAATTAYGETDT